MCSILRSEFKEEIMMKMHLMMRAVDIWTITSLSRVAVRVVYGILYEIVMDKSVLKQILKVVIFIIEVYSDL